VKYIKITLYLLIIVLIIYGGWYLFQKKDSEDVYVSNTITLDELRAEPEKDTDGDGLKDWEEVLWKTDPEKADTDGDGTNDFAEIQENRDPTIKGPADVLQKSIDSQTKDLSKNLFGYYLEQRKAVGDVTTEASAKIVSEAIKNSYKTVTYITHTQKDLTISKDNSLSAYKKYGVDLANAMSGFSVKENELGIVIKALSTKDETDLYPLDALLTNYRSALSKIVSVNVPSNLSGKHLAFVNSTSKVIIDIQGMRGLFEDSVLALSSLTTYGQNFLQFQKSLKEISSELKKKGVEYSTGEVGYGLLNVL